MLVRRWHSGRGYRRLRQWVGGGGSGGQVSGSGAQLASGGTAVNTGGISSATGGISGGANTGGAPGTGGVISGTGGTSNGGSGGASGGTPNTGGSASGGETGDAGTGGKTGTGACCADGDCLCHGTPPSALTSDKGSFTTATFTVSTGTVYYPTNAEPPFAAVALCAGYTNTGPEMAAWGPFYASYGIVLEVVTTVGSDQPATRGDKLLAAVKQLKGENTRQGSPLFGKLSDRFGTSGYSMGGGGTTLASAQDATLKTSIGLAPYGGKGTGIKVPTLLMCGASDTTAPCTMSQSVYTAIPNDTPKMMISAIAGTTHFNWFGPTQAGGGTSGKYALAFEKVFLEGDERWKPLLLGKPTNATQTTNIQ